VHDDRVFYSALVAAGRLGVIYSMVVELEAEYWLTERRAKENYPIVKAQLTASATTGIRSAVGLNSRMGPGLMFFGAVINVNRPSECWTMERRVFTGPLVEENTDKQSWDDILFCAPVGVELIPTILGLVVGTAAATVAIPVVGEVVATTLVAAATTALTTLYVGRQFASLGEVIGTLMEIVPGITPALLDFALQQFEGSPATKTGPSGKVLDQMDYSAPRNCYDGDQFEYFFNAESTGYLSFVDAVLAIAATVGDVPGYVNMRFTQHSDAYVTMQQFPFTVGVEVVVMRPSSRGSAFLSAASALAASFGGIPHWGKNVQGVPRDITRFTRGSRDAFEYAIRLIEGPGPATFSSQFTRSSGLEPTRGLGVDPLDRLTSRGRVSVREVLSVSQRRLGLPWPPTSVMDLARRFPPSLRMNADGVPLRAGRAAASGPRVRLRDLSRRFV
jgi:hypothetical protein